MQSRNWAYSTHPTELRALLCESLWAGLSMFERYRKQFAKTAVQHSLTPHSSYVSVHGRSQQATPPWPAVLSLRTVNRREALWTTRTKRALSHRLPITLLGVHPVVVRRINMDWRWYWAVACHQAAVQFELQPWAQSITGQHLPQLSWAGSSRTHPGKNTAPRSLSGCHTFSCSLCLFASYNWFLIRFQASVPLCCLSVHLWPVEYNFWLPFPPFHFDVDRVRLCRQMATWDLNSLNKQWQQIITKP